MTMLLPTWWGSLSQRYAAGLILEAFKYAAFVLAGAEAIFLSDAIIADLLPEVLRHQADTTSLMALIVLTVPRVLMVALPLALLVGTYLAMVARRQATEFTVLAGIGHSSRSLIALAAMIGLGGLVLSLFLSGFVEPLARHQLTRTVFDIRFDALRDGKIAAGRFYQFGDYSVFASSGRINEVASNFFVHQRIGELKNRIVIANQTTRVRVTQRPNVGLMLEDVAIHEFEHRRSPVVAEETASDACDDCGGRAAGSPFQVATFDRMFIEFPAADLAPPAPRGSDLRELTSPELWSLSTRDNGAAALLGDRLLRGVVCLLAPLLGLLAVALTTDKTYLVALPIAGGIVLSGGFLGSFAVEFVAPLGLPAMAGILAALAASAAAAISVGVAGSERGFIGALGVRL